MMKYPVDEKEFTDYFISCLGVGNGFDQTISEFAELLAKEMNIAYYKGVEAGRRMSALNH